MIKVLLVGGCGYIGSHMWKSLVLRGYHVVVVDNLSTGHESCALDQSFYNLDLMDAAGMDALFREHKFDAVMHFAAKSLVGESVLDPMQYYRNNVVGTFNLLEKMLEYNIDNFIFSSTAATFGEPRHIPISSDHKQDPINPYGSSKLMVETMLKDFSLAYGLDSVCLRYFNACGADPECEIGECHDPETHLLPLILQAASGRREDIRVFGRDYDTPDGTCIRDYVHVMDLCQAHESSMLKLLSGEIKGAKAYNLGNGSGYSVQEIIDVSRSVVAEDGRYIKVFDEPRRAGDPAMLVADGSLARKELNWQPQYADLETIVRHAWAWEKKISGLSK